jgi:ribulose-phosphate 3-epimerase
MRLPRAGTIEIVPSVLAADFGCLATEVAQVEAAGVKMIQFDIMDGHFVPNISFGPPIVAAMRPHTTLAFDVQLMISEPQRYVEAFVLAGADHITFHIETVDRPLDLVDDLHKAGVTAGIALNPQTDVLRIIDVAPYCELVLVMTVHPGFGGQEFIPEMAEKVRRVRELVGPATRIEVDGGISPQTAPEVVHAGADTFVVGTAIFSKRDRLAAIAELRNALERAEVLDKGFPDTKTSTGPDRRNRERPIPQNCDPDTLVRKG